MKEEENCSEGDENERKIQVLTPEEKNNFHGVTIDEEGEESGSRDKTGFEGQQHIYIHQVNLGAGSSLWSKLLLGLFLAVVLFFALPFAFFFLIVGAFIWFFLSR